MKYIQKIAEPIQLQKYRAIPGATYADMPTDVKSALRSALLKSQGYICCYCMQRVSEDKCKIEHFKPQSIYNGKEGKTDLTLNYQNLFIACNGYEGTNDLTCDSKKGAQELYHINLLDVQCGENFRYTRDGIICAMNNNNSDLKKEIHEILNLNKDTLQWGRKAVYDEVFTQFQNASKNGKFTIGFLNKQLRHWTSKNSENKFQPYCMVAIYIIQKYIRKIQNQNNKK